MSLQRPKPVLFPTRIRSEEFVKRARTFRNPYELQMTLHVEKIAAELKRDNPDYGLIWHWQKEVQTWTERAERLRKRLPGKR